MNNRIHVLWLVSLLVVVTGLLIFFWTDHFDSESPVLGLNTLDEPADTGEPILPLPQRITGLDPAKVQLGRQLFYETRLSRSNTMSCDSCHPLDSGGTDKALHPVGSGANDGMINTPTVFNTAFSFRQFWDGRVASLEQEVDGPLISHLEMDSTWDIVLERLGKDDAYRTVFAASYPDGVTPDNVRDALANFERSLITPNSRFDRYLLGDKQAVDTEELAGYTLFMDYGCINCHQGVNVGGNMYEKLGVMRDYFNDANGVKRADMGRYAYTHIEEHLHEFKVPSLRNVALTPPYFHNGSADTLQEAVSIMGKYQLGLELPKRDIDRIVAFLNTLTGEYSGKLP